MKTVCIVQARLTSTRLPGKAMLCLGGEPSIRHVLRRCKEIPGIDRVICAVPDNKYSLPIKREAYGLGVSVMAGPEHDVLTRYWKAAEASEADIIMRVTGDCPLIDPKVCGRVLELMTDGIDYASNVHPRSFPKGYDCEVFTRQALDLAYKNAEFEDREHVCPWMERNLHCANLSSRHDSSDINYSLDTLEDYAFLSERFNGH